MRKLISLFLIGSIILFLGVDTALAQKKVRVAMFLWRYEAPGVPFSGAEEGFVDGLKQAGYDVDYEIFMADMKKEKLQEMWDALDPKKFDMLYAFGTTVAQLISKDTKGLPFVFTQVTYPVKSGVVQSFEKPGGMSTGTTHRVSVEANFNAFTKVIPNIKTLGMIYCTGENNSVLDYEGVKALAAKSGIKFVAEGVSAQAEIKGAFDRIAAQKPDGMYMPSCSFTKSYGAEYVAYANKLKIPTLAGTEAFVTQQGALMGLVGSYYKTGQESAKKAVKILQGAKPSDVPTTFLPEFDYVLNLKTAKEIGVTFPISILRAASKIIKE
ncbi:MAG: ABC transporter substrate-binding protein [Candidatus Omnitrophota bacterium]